MLTTPWKVFLILNIGEHTIRFGSLKLCLQAVSRVTLTKYLHELERDGFVQRIEYPAPPLRTEYSLTPMGLSLLPILQELRNGESNSCKAFVLYPQGTAAVAGRKDAI